MVISMRLAVSPWGGVLVFATRLRCFVLHSIVLSLTGAAFVLSGCGGSGSSKSSQPTPAANPTPTISSITPSSLVAGSSAQTITIAGTGFISSSAINLNGAALATTYVSSTSVTAAVPAAAITADGTAKISATNPSPGGGTSAIQNYVISVPVAAMTSLSPQSITQGAAVTITITGTGFEANSVVQWDGSARPTTFVDASTLKVTLTAADVQNFGTGSLAVANPGLAPTTPLELTITSSTPTILSISPNPVAAYTGTDVPQQVYIYGSGFAPNATVQANGQLVPIVSQNVMSVIVTLSAAYFAGPGTINLVVSNPGSPVVSSNAAVLTVTGPAAPSFSLSPIAAPAGSPDTTVTLNGTGFYKDSLVSWNKTPLGTTYVNSSQVSAVIPATLLTGLVQASISVATPENTIQAAPQPFTTYLPLAVNDIVFNSVDGYIYASVPGVAGEGLGNTVAAIDPTTGVIQKTIFVGSQPNRLALSSDGTQLFVGLDGAGAVRQVDLTKNTAGVQFPLGGGPGLYNPPYTAVGLATVPGAPDSVAVYATNGVVTIFDSGVARAKTSSGLSTYFDSNVGGLAFGSSASTLYVMSNAVGNYLYQLAVDPTGITASTQIGSGTGGSTMQYDNGRLYVPTGVVFSATTGAQLGQFSTGSNSTSSPTPAVGPIVSDSALNRAWILVQNYGALTDSLIAFDETTFNPVDGIQVTGIGAFGSSSPSNPADLIRWGQDGLAFHTANQLFVLQGAFVKDTSGSPADVAVSVQAPATATTGSSLTYTINVQNMGPNPAQGINLSFILPESVIFNNVQATQGSCSGSGVSYCNLGTLASGSSATVTVAVTPTLAGSLGVTATVSTVSFDPVSINNQASGATTVTGSAFSPVPTVTQLVPNMVQAGSGSFLLTLDGIGFNSASTVSWNGQALPTTLLSTGQMTANVDASLIKQLGWAQISVTTRAPGGGTSAAVPFTIYQLLNVPANAISFDPFTQKLYAVLPSLSPTLTGNSIVAIDPATGSVGTPVVVGSEPNLLSETSDGNYLWIGLSGAKSLGRFNLLNQSPDLTVPLPTNANYTTGTAAATAMAAVPGSDSSLAVEIDSFDGIGIFDVSGSTGKFRSKSGFGYSGDNPVFVDATHFYAYDAYTTGAEFYRYTVDANGAELTDGTTLLGMGGFGGKLAVDGGLVYGTGGGIVDPSTTPPSQVAVLPLGATSYGSFVTGGGAIPYAAEAKSFNVVTGLPGVSAIYVERFDTQHFTLEDLIPLPSGGTSGAVQGTRWSQDGLAFLIPTTTSANATTNQIFLIRGPFVLPEEAFSNTAPSLTSTDHSTIAVGSGNIIVTVTGSGFLPGATVFWNNSARTTTWVDATHLTVSIPAADVKTAGSVSVTGVNPGSTASNSVSITVK
jgi:uncharacterized repeat protein (TIGR01451 family)